MLSLKQNHLKKMGPPVFAGYVICLLLGNLTFVTGLAPSSSALGFEIIDVGWEVTLKCQENSAMSFYWYKQTHGQKPKLMSEFLKHTSNGSLKSPFKNNPRFELVTVSGKNNLKISNVQRSDSATYYCVSGHSFMFDFLEGIVVQVKDSASNFQTLVYQSAFQTIHPGDSVTLNCTVHTGICDGEHRVYWLKNFDESNPRIIYRQGDRKNQCEMKPNSQTHTCMYNLPLKNLNVSHAGTYYCAVASCGNVLFGNGTKLDYKEKLDYFVLLYILTGTLAFIVVLMVLLAYTSYKLYNTKKCNCKDPPDRSSDASAPNAEVSVDADDLHYAAISEKNIVRSITQSEASNVCVYSTLKQ